MNSSLRVIKYLFKKKNIINEDESIDSFFSNGISFPQFISLIFDDESIPGIKKNPTQLFQKKINNNCALQYLFQKNEKIKSICPTFETEKNQIHLLQLIFTMQCFTENINDIIQKSNIILNKIGINIFKKSELNNLKILSSVLNILTDKTFPVSDNFSEISDNFTKFDIPLIIDENSFDVQNSYFFLIQYQIIFDIFADRFNLNSQDQNQALIKDNLKFEEGKEHHEQSYNNEINEKIEEKQNDENPEKQLNDHDHDSLSDYSDHEDENADKNEDELFMKYLERQNQNSEEMNFEDINQQKEFQQFENFISDSFEEEEEEKKEEEVNNNDNDNETTKIDNFENKNDGKDQEEEEEEEANDDDDDEKTENQSSLLHKLNNLKQNMTNMVGYMKKYRYADSVIKRLELDQSIEPEKIWNIPIDDYKYSNGIVSIKDKKSDKQAENNSENESVNLEQKPNYHKLFRYDEKKYHWQFIESNFKNLYSNSKSDMLCPIFLFIDSKINEIDEITLRQNDLIQNADEEISVYSFSNQVIESEKTAQSFNEPVFLYVHVPNKKVNHKNIGEILIQIYSFLFLICDLDIIIIDEQNKNAQINFIMKIIDFSSLYLPTHDDQSFNFFDKSKILFLSLSKKNISHSLEALIKPKINKKYLINCIKKDSNEFNKIIDETCFNRVYIYSDLFAALLNINSLFPQLSSLYIYLRNKYFTYKFIKNIELKRYAALYSEKNKETVIQTIKDECKQYCPKNDANLSNIIHRASVEIQINNGLFDTKNVEAQLKNQSQVNLSHLTQKIDEKLFLDEDKFIIMKLGHISFVQQKYFEILKKIDPIAVDILYDKNRSILSSQIKEDETYLKSIFQKFLKKIKERQSLIEEEFKEASKKGTNYVMKEVEKTKEIEVIVEAGQNIDSVIETDY